MGARIVAVDQGTTGTTVLVVDEQGQVFGRGYREHDQIFPSPGRVEHDATQIWQRVVECTRLALGEAGLQGRDVDAVGITNQRETVVAWDAVSGEPLAPAIVWQDRRTEPQCQQLRDEGAQETVRARAGLPVDPYFSATKFAWLLANDEAVQAAERAGTLRLGTIDAWLVHRMSAGGVHATDVSNASRTMLFDIHELRWSAELAGLVGMEGVDLQQVMPTVVPSIGELARTDPAAFAGIDAPVAGMAGDQQAALFGQACTRPGEAKATYGTGAFVLVNSGDRAPETDALISTVAWQQGAEVTYALEASIFTAGAAVQWLRDGLQFFSDSTEVESLAASVPDSGGVVVVPAFAGIGAPVWDADARAAVLGITRGTNRAHVARAVLEAVAFRVRQTVDAMAVEGVAARELRVDGGMARNDLFLQIQADVLGTPVTRPANVETTSLGAAFLAALGTGALASMQAVRDAWQPDRTFEPVPRSDEAEERYQRFLAATDAVRMFGSRAHTAV